MTTNISHTAITSVRRALLALALLLCANALAAAAASAATIPDQYIVTIKEGRDPATVARSIDADPQHVYESALNGFAARLDGRQLEALGQNDEVEAIEADAEVSTTQTMDAGGDPWGLDRIDQAALPLSRDYTFERTGRGVTAYVLDTGLAEDHPEFGGRAKNVYNATSSSSGADCNGHGTHVAGIVGASTYGVAKRVSLRGVKVLGGDCTRLGWKSDAIEGIDWVLAHHATPAVANMSFGGPPSVAERAAVTSLVLGGVFVAVSAGNNASDACFTAPANVQAAYTTASSDRDDARSSFSNWGPCVDGYAPGRSIKSVWNLSPFGTFKSGTSMAAPHVAGVAALLCSDGPLDCMPSSITNWINANATNGVITDNGPATPNRLLNKRAL